MKKIIIALCVCMYIAGNMYAQLITTIAGPNTGINDALVMDSVGNIYGSEFGNSPLVSSSVYKIDTTGAITKFSTGYGSCNGLAFDCQWNLYVVDFTLSVNSHQIYKLDSLGNKTPYGPTISGASGILFTPTVIRCM